MAGHETTISDAKSLKAMKPVSDVEAAAPARDDVTTLEAEELRETRARPGDPVRRASQGGPEPPARREGDEEVA